MRTSIATDPPVPLDVSGERNDDRASFDAVAGGISLSFNPIGA